MTTNETLDKIIKTLFNIPTNNYIFIYTPPKVGSTTLVTSLRVSLGKSFNIIHIHDEIMLNVLTGIDNITINEIIHYLSFTGKNVYVIDVYRTPIERKMSAFFEKISQYHFNNSEENINKYNISRIINRFNNLFPHLENGDHYLDKYNITLPIPFDFNEKYTIQTIDQVHFIKLRLCDSYLWSNILSKIFELDIILINDYQTESKNIGQLYKKFKEEYTIPINYLNEVETCKYLNYYYSEQEKITYINNWKTKQSQNSHLSYTENEFKFYLNICLENQYINDIQIEHYLDNGCFCGDCSLKRRDIYMKAKNGEKQFDKIIHTKHLHKIPNKINTKFLSNQFSIKLNNN
jgi:hypothetical protein